jgi:hypothetical protein
MSLLNISDPSKIKTILKPRVVHLCDDTVKKPINAKPKSIPTKPVTRKPNVGDLSIQEPAPHKNAKLQIHKTRSKETIPVNKRKTKLPVYKKPYVEGPFAKRKKPEFKTPVWFIKLAHYMDYQLPNPVPYKIKALCSGKNDLYSISMLLIKGYPVRYLNKTGHCSCNTLRRLRKLLIEAFNIKILCGCGKDSKHQGSCDFRNSIKEKDKS